MAGVFQGADDQYQKRPLSTITNKERLQILSCQTKTVAQLEIIDKRATAVSVLLFAWN